METERKASPAARILVVDDDPQARDMLRRWLTRRGYEAVEASGGQACLGELAKGAPVDVIVLDVMMPGMDGLQVCELLRASEEWRLIPVILVTAKDDLETRARGMELGVSEYLTKPVSRQELFERVQAQIRSRELQRTLARTAASIEKGGDSSS